MWTTERQSDFYANTDSPEIQGRMHRDLRALQGLSNELPEILGARVIVEKGYAIDAACNGRLTRTHYDTDLILATPYADEPEALYGVIKEVLERATNMEWVATQQKRKSWVKFHEADKRQWDDGITNTAKDAELAHQMDLHFVHSPNPFADDRVVELQPKPGLSYEKPITTARIWDTFGQKYDLTIPTVNDMLATKLRLIRSFDTFYGHSQRESDLYDFKMLFSHPEFNPDEFVAILDDYYANQGLSEEERIATIRKELVAVEHLAPTELLDSLAN